MPRVHMTAEEELDFFGDDIISDLLNDEPTEIDIAEINALLGDDIGAYDDSPTVPYLSDSEYADYKMFSENRHKKW